MIYWELLLAIILFIGLMSEIKYNNKLKTQIKRQNRFIRELIMEMEELKK